MTSRTNWTVFLISLAMMAVEILWTRIFSAEFFYTFAFLVLSLAILGLGLGALALRLFPRLVRGEYLWIYLGLAALGTLVAPPLIFNLGLVFSQVFQSWLMVGKLLLAVILLGIPYAFAGMALALLFRLNHEYISRLYMIDLLGAALGLILCIPAMNLLGTPVVVFLSALPLIAAAFFESRRYWRLVPVLLILPMAFLLRDAGNLLTMVRQERAPLVSTHWDAVAKVKVIEYNENYRGLVIDNVANSPIYRFDGNWNRPDSLKYEFNLDVSYLMAGFDSCRFLSLGAGGGVDVLQALQYGATEVHAVEVIPYINEIMTTGELAEYTGGIYNDPRVHVATEDARVYVRQHPNQFDIIYSLSSNTFSAMASGAFALAENYLFTEEAFRDYWRALSPGGFMMMEHQFYVPRLVSAALDALKGLGVEDPENHIAAYNLPQLRRKVILFSKTPLDEEIRYNALGPLTAERHDFIHLLYPAADSLTDNAINRIVREGWLAVQQDVPYDISPVTDNRPFAAQMGMWKNLNREAMERILPYEFFGFPLSKLIILVILAVVLVLVLPLTLLPYLNKKGMNLHPLAWGYYFLIGMGFMLVEIILIQQYALFIGTTIFSLLTVLGILLLMSGLGSRVAGKVPAITVFMSIALWIFLNILLFPVIQSLLIGLCLTGRMIISMILIAPVGFFMGMPFPKAGMRVGAAVDWGFAVNGAASVVGSVLAVLLAINFGYAFTLAVAALVYLGAWGLYSRREAW